MDWDGNGTIMLSFDIETTGLQKADTITAACAYDPERGICATFIFARGDDPNEFIRLLDEADQLCAFNGARFDIPFMRKEWCLSREKVHAWMVKLVDVYESCMLVFQRGFSLNQLLTVNKIPVKTGSGKEAIDLALQQRWDELGDYCLQDTIKTYNVTTLPRIELPLRFPRYSVVLQGLHFHLVDL